MINWSKEPLKLPTVEQALADGEFFIKLGQMRRTYLFDVIAHGHVGFQQIGEYRQQAIFVARHFFAFHFQIKHRQEFPVGTGIADQGLALGIFHEGWLRYAVVGMAAEYGVNAGNPGGHFQIHIHAVVR